MTTTTVPLSQDSISPAPVWLQANPLRNVRRNSQPPRTAAVLAFPSTKSPLACSPAGAVRRHALSAQGITAEIVQSAGEERIESQICSTSHTLIAYESGTRRDGMSVIDGLPPSSVKNIARKFTFVPAGTELREWHGAHAGISAIYFHFDAGILPDDKAGEDTRSLAPSLFFEDEALWDTVAKMKAMLSHSTVDDRPYFEALALVLAHEVMRRRHSDSSSRPLARGGLAPWQQRAALAYIDSHLNEPIALATLAGIARLSPYYFCRAFKQSMGVPPHRYHANRRIEVAKKLLLKRDQSITEIGLSLGFRETSSFSSAFRKATGMTPRQYQRSAS
jgi:AraC family transcriptional regulator